MWARCRSTEPGRWARPRTWWQWSRAACSLDCIQTAPPCQRQSRCRCAFQTWAPGLSCTEWRSSLGRLRARSDEDKGHRRTGGWRNKAAWARGRLCQVGKRRFARETARQSRQWEKMAKLGLISPHVISHSAMRRSGANILSLHLGSGRTWPTAFRQSLSNVLSAWQQPIYSYKMRQMPSLEWISFKKSGNTMEKK